MRRIGRWGAVVTTVVSLLSLSGCWGQPRFSAGWTSYNPYEETLAPADARRITELWHAPLPAEGWPLAAWRDRVLVRSGDEVVGLDAVTGTEVWRAPSFGLTYVRDGVLYVPRFDDPTDCDGEAFLEARDTATGARLPDEDVHAWDDPVCDGPDGIIGLGDRYGLLHGYRLLNEEPPAPPTESTVRLYDWQTGTTTLLPQAGGSYGPLDEASEQYHVIRPAGGGGGESSVEAWSFTGVQLWSHVVYLSSPTSPVVDGGRLYVGNRYTFGHEGFDVLDTGTGAELWHGTVPGQMVQPAVRSGVVYTGLVATEDGPLLAYEDCGEPSCDPIWTGTGTGRVTEVIAAGDLVYASTRDDEAGRATVRIYAADGCGRPTCRPLKTITLEGAHTTAIVSDGRLLVATPGDGVRAYGLRR
jgi:outer membrane protein assembly factor BamB